MTNPPTLLLVEDEPLIRAVVVDAMVEGGYLVLESEDGADAIAKIDANPAIVGIITDIRLSGGSSGWELARHARSMNAKVAVVYMSGDSSVDWAAEGVPNSVRVQKPFANAQLLTAISTLLNATETRPSPPPTE